MYVCVHACYNMGFVKAEVSKHKSSPRKAEEDEEEPRCRQWGSQVGGGQGDAMCLRNKQTVTSSERGGGRQASRCERQEKKREKEEASIVCEGRVIGCPYPNRTIKNARASITVSQLQNMLQYHRNIK